MVGVVSSVIVCVVVSLLSITSATNPVPVGVVLFAVNIVPVLLSVAPSKVKSVATPPFESYTISYFLPAIIEVAANAVDCCPTGNNVPDASTDLPFKLFLNVL